MTRGEIRRTILSLLSLWRPVFYADLIAKEDKDILSNDMADLIESECRAARVEVLGQAETWIYNKHMESSNDKGYLELLYDFRQQIIKSNKE